MQCFIPLEPCNVSICEGILCKVHNLKVAVSGMHNREQSETDRGKSLQLIFLKKTPRLKLHLSFS